MDFPAIDLIEVQVFSEEDDHRLVAAIELVRPSNKDRPSERRAFATKCASYLHQGTSVIIVDVVTTRRFQLHEALVRLLELQEVAWRSPTSLYAVAYRATGADDQRELQAWPEVLTIGSALPILPLWIGSAVSDALDLEPTYLATCEDLRLPTAG